MRRESLKNTPPGHPHPAPRLLVAPRTEAAACLAGPGLAASRAARCPFPIAAMAAAHCAGVCPRLWLGFVPERAVNAATGAAGTVRERGRRVGRHGG